jgi:hypothetical protein
MKFVVHMIQCTLAGDGVHCRFIQLKVLRWRCSHLAVLAVLLPVRNQGGGVQFALAGGTVWAAIRVTDEEPESGR